MDKEILFLSYNKEMGTISGCGTTDDDMIVVDGTKFPAAFSIELPKSELIRFETENNTLQYNEEHKIYNFGGENPPLLVTNCKFKSNGNNGVIICSADSWKWI